MPAVTLTVRRWVWAVLAILCCLVSFAGWRVIAIKGAFDLSSFRLSGPPKLLVGLILMSFAVAIPRAAWLAFRGGAGLVVNASGVQVAAVRTVTRSWSEIAGFEVQSPSRIVTVPRGGSKPMLIDLNLLQIPATMDARTLRIQLERMNPHLADIAPPDREQGAPRSLLADTFTVRTQSMRLFGAGVLLLGAGLLMWGPDAKVVNPPWAIRVVGLVATAALGLIFVWTVAYVRPSPVRIQDGELRVPAGIASLRPFVVELSEIDMVRRTRNGGVHILTHSRASFSLGPRTLHNPERLIDVLSRL